MKRTRRLLREEITYSLAKEREVNVLHQLGYFDQQCRFFSRLDNKREWMKAVIVIAHHLGLESHMCHIANMQDWFRGSFNACVPQPGHRVVSRFPLPYRVGQGFQPGNGDKKIQYEAGAYVWLQEDCPDVPNPYDCIECIEETQGTMLSNTWSEKQHDVELRMNLFRGFSQILLSVSRTPLPRVGFFITNKQGYLTLSNRPLSIELQQLENEEIPTRLSRDYTYSTMESYITDLLEIHNNRLRHQPNTINNVQDCGYQMSALAAIRTVATLFFHRDLHRGSFSNIFVDDEWRITCLVDLE
ncbi:hypothetical protein N7512_008967 [Penicillium capsulatum]|nr:hypothetical protein N7512_008967 [Penicillium capsulatum]